MRFLIVNFRTPDLAVRCIKSMTAVGVSPGDIVVVDNCSGDDSAAKIAAALPNVRMIRAERNGGFAAGVNIGMKQINADYVLVLNPDTLFVSNFVDDLTEILDNDKSIGVIGLNLLNPDMTPQYSARRFYSLLDVFVRRSSLKSMWPWRLLDDRHLMKKELAAGVTFNADWVLGTGFVVRKAVYDRLQGMDEGYFLYMEDVDLCARVWQAQYRVVCVPTAAIIHDHQRESAKSLTSTASKRHLSSFKRFYGKFNVPAFYVKSREKVIGVLGA